MIGSGVLVQERYGLKPSFDERTNRISLFLNELPLGHHDVDNQPGNSFGITVNEKV